jgi:hypothetical protein
MNNIRLFAGLLALLLMRVPAGGDSVHMNLVNENIVGVVLHADGITPVAGLPIRVWNESTKKMVCRTKTDRDGIFAIPDNLTKGSTFIYIGRLKVNVQMYAVEEGSIHQHHDIVVVLPRVMLMPSMPVVETVILPGTALEVFLVPALQAVADESPSRDIFFPPVPPPVPPPPPPVVSP